MKLGKELQPANIEEKLSIWIWHAKYRIILLGALFLFFKILGVVPYFNLFFTENLIWLFTIASVVILFYFNIKPLLWICVVLFGLAFLSTSIDRRETAEQIGNIIYVILFIGVVKEIFQFHETDTK